MDGFLRCVGKCASKARRRLAAQNGFDGALLRRQLAGQSGDRGDKLDERANTAHNRQRGVSRIPS